MKWWYVALACLMLQACGGGSDAPAVQPVALEACSVADQQQSLLAYMRDEYFWYQNLGKPDTGAEAMDGYFQSMLYRPADRFSYTQPTTAYQQLFTVGRRVGYGYTLVWTDATHTAARVRNVEPQSPVARAGLKRGDIVLAIDGYTPADIFAGLVPTVDTPGVLRTITIRDSSGQPRQIMVISDDFPLTPVTDTKVLDVAGPAGPVKVGYLAYNQFVSYSEDQLAAAFAGFAQAGVSELILDLRYNGGGSVAVSRDLASMIGGAASADQLFAYLRFNDKQAVLTTQVRFNTPTATAGTALAPGFKRVIIIASGATASASELVINGLRPFVNVVLVGETTYGKPYGFVPRSSCGTTYQAVNFESLNALGVGGYTAGFQPDCLVADDLDHALGDTAERRTATALNYIATGRCSADSIPLRSAAQRQLQPQRPATAGEDWPDGMFLD